MTIISSKSDLSKKIPPNLKLWSLQGSKLSSPNAMCEIEVIFRYITYFTPAGGVKGRELDGDVKGKPSPHQESAWCAFMLYSPLSLSFLVCHTLSLP